MGVIGYNERGMDKKEKKKKEKQRLYQSTLMQTFNLPILHSRHGNFILVIVNRDMNNFILSLYLSN